MKIKFTLIALLMFVTSSITAQFSLSGEFRPRSEYLGNGQSKTAVDGDEGYLSTSVRAALMATYTAETYTLYTSFQEVFVFGDRVQIARAGNGNFRVQEAWADIKLGSTTTLKFGRQPISYDDQRILGGLGWAQQARTHDAGIFKYKKSGYSVDLGLALNTPTSAVYDQSKFFSYREMAYLHANKKFGKLNLSALAMANTFQDSSTASLDQKSTLVTAGIHAGYTAGPLSLLANAYIQDGNRLGEVAVEGAYLASILATVKATDKITFGAGYEVISGKTDDSAAFFPLYGTNHKFNGYMDRFYVGNHGNAGGLQDIQLSASTKLAGMAISLTGHIFSEQEDIDGLGKELGSELDLVIAKKFKEFKLVGGYSQYFEPSTVVATAKGTQNWAWLMLIIKPKFL